MDTHPRESYRFALTVLLCQSGSRMPTSAVLALPSFRYCRVTGYAVTFPVSCAVSLCFSPRPLISHFLWFYMVLECVYSSPRILWEHITQAPFDLVISLRPGNVEFPEAQPKALSVVCCKMCR